jgi:hypothetical protein
MRKSRKFLFATLVGMLMLATTLCACSTTPSTQYKRVTFAELTGNSTAYDGQNISISGIYLDQFAGQGCLAVACYCNCSETKIIESYQPLSRLPFWGIGENGTTIAFVPPGDKDGNIHTPNFETGKAIVVKGRVNALLWVPPCPCPCSCERYKTLLIYADEISAR